MTMPDDAGGGDAVLAVIRTGPGGTTPLPDDAVACLMRTVVDTHLHLPGMFEITFHDQSGDVVQTAGLSIGTEVHVLGLTGSGESVPLIVGEITSIEGVFERLTFLTVVRGYDKANRLQRTRRTRTFVNMKDSDIASQLATDGGLTLGQIDTSPTTHDHLGQCDQTDWEFLTQRAREIGFETGMSEGDFYFRKASTVQTASGQPVELMFNQNLWAFRPRVTAGNLAPEVEVRVWDPIQATVVAARTATTTGTVELDGEDPAATAQTFAPPAEPDAPAGPSSAVGNLGPAPGDDAFVVFNRPAATGSAATAAVTAVADSLAEHVGSTFAEAEGDAAGDAAIQPGNAVQIANVPAPFAGTWMVTNARHIFDVSEGGAYQTRFVVSGRQERSLFGLASGATGLPAPPRIPGLAFGVVTNNNDPDQHGQVKVALPWLSPDYESYWAPVVQFGAGKRSGAMFLPEVGDEVLVGFEFGDPRRPCVLGGIVNAASAYSLGGPPIKATGMAAEVVLRGFVSGAGNLLVFHDEVPPGDGAPPSASDIVLGTSDGSLSLKIDQVAGTVTLTCKPAPPASQTAAGQLTIQCGDAGTINIQAGAGGSVNIDGGASLSLKAQGSIEIQSSGQVAIKGNPIMLN